MVGVKGMAWGTGTTRDPVPRSPTDPGFYWVRCLDAEPEVARWEGTHWLLSGSPESFSKREVRLLSYRLRMP